MWIKARSVFVNLEGGASVRRDVSAIRLETEGRAVRIADYVNPDRAEEVMAEFWAAVKRGDRGYEFPEI